MFDNILQRMRNKIRTGDYVITLHADEELAAEDLSVFDVERCILTGKIVERQKDRQTNETKYRILGFAVNENLMEVIAKLGPTGRLFIITAYSL
ncbi:MAG: DUF4258 domain-containing protein [candidate division KSB1 bacterium]|nr:DUF4258 domain-containing protein [candidate division KSB1 bacterium]